LRRAKLARVANDCRIGARYAAKGVIRFMLSEAQTLLGHLSWKRERELAVASAPGAARVRVWQVMSR